MRLIIFSSIDYDYKTKTNNNKQSFSISFVINMLYSDCYGLIISVRLSASNNVIRLITDIMTCMM